MTRTRTVLVLVVAALGCYGTPRTSFPEDDGGAGMGGGTAGTGSGQAGTGGTGAGSSGTGGRGTGGSNPVFVGGPCIVRIPGSMNVEAFARTSDSHISRRPFDGRTWSSWTTLAGLDGSLVDARSDLDCAASGDTVHIVATGVNPVGALQHAFGFGASYNPFVRELNKRAVAQSPSVSLLSNDALYVAWAGSGQEPGLFSIDTGSDELELTPITSLTKSLVSAADISQQLNSIFFTAFDSVGRLAIYKHSMSSGGAVWAEAVTLESPGLFAFSPTICAEAGLVGSSSVNVAAVVGQTLWFSGTGAGSSWPQFSAWTMISGEAASSPDCVVLRENPSLDPIVHIVILNSHGTVTDVVGSGASWVTTDLGPPS